MKLDTLENILEEDGIVFVSYGGFLTQSLIAGMTDALEKEAQNNELSQTISTNIFVVFIELAQNMMNYAKARSDLDEIYESKGLIIVGQENNGQDYYIISRNLVDSADKEALEERLKMIEGRENGELRTLYREQRKVGKEQHNKGAGIGFIEIARRCDSVEHRFIPESDNRYYFTMKTLIKRS